MCRLQKVESGYAGTTRNNAEPRRYVSQTGQSQIFYQDKFDSRVLADKITPGL